MPLPLTVSCSSKIQIGFTFLVPAYPGYPGKEAVKWLLLLLYVVKVCDSMTRSNIEMIMGEFIRSVRIMVESCGSAC